MCDVSCEIWGARIVPCCQCENWCHLGCSYQTHLERICPCHVQVLDPKRKIVVLSHPYLEDYVVLPTRPAIRVSESAAQGNCQAIAVGCLEDGLLVWSYVGPRLSAGLLWHPEAADAGRKATPEEHVREEAPQLDQIMPCINLFEYWEGSGQLVRDVNAHSFAFPFAFSTPCPWIFRPLAITLHEACEVPAGSLKPNVYYPNHPSLEGSTCVSISDPL